MSKRPNSVDESHVFAANLVVALNQHKKPKREFVPRCLTCHNSHRTSDCPETTLLEKMELVKKRELCLICEHSTYVSADKEINHTLLSCKLRFVVKTYTNEECQQLGALHSPGFCFLPLLSTIATPPTTTD